MWFRKNIFYILLVVSIISGVMALIFDVFPLRSGTAGFGAIIITIINFRKEKPSKESWFIVVAFLFSIGGDWFLSNMNGEPMMFSKGIALFFLAHIGYLLFALYSGRINWRITTVIIIGFLIYFFLKLYPTIETKFLMWAALGYLFVSCISFGAAVGIKKLPIVKKAYVFGIFLVLFSDTIISLNEFLDYHKLAFIILPTYYLAHISITFSMIKEADLKKKKNLA
jgi:uncharacterized membrane protein YhhN